MWTICGQSVGGVRSFESLEKLQKPGNASNKCFFPQHKVEGLLNSRPREIAIIAGFAFSGPPRATGVVIIFFFVPLLNSFYTECQILIPAKPDFT